MSDIVCKKCGSPNITPGRNQVVDDEGHVTEQEFECTDCHDIWRVEYKRSNTIDVCDTVRHVPSGEKWVVACVDGDRLYWFGYPFGGSAALSDCQLVHKASRADMQKALVKLAELTGFEVPILRARDRLREPHLTEPTHCAEG